MFSTPRGSHNMGGIVWRYCIVLTVLASLSGGCDGADERQEVTRLPGQPTVNFKHYAGYVTVNESHGRALFYWFFESSHRHAAQRPLVLWLNGGPGCSSVGYGALTELGPFFTNSSGNGLVLNRNSWTKAANIIFLESPFGTGFSYTRTDSDYNHLSDELIAEDAHAFLVGWFKKFPEYAQNEFYLAGESYAGHYIPTLARVIVRENKSPNGFRINFKGFAVGNPWTDPYSDNLGTTEFYYSHSLISEETFDSIKNNCDFQNDLAVDEGSSNVTCNKAVREADMDLMKIDRFNVYGLSCNGHYSVPVGGWTQKYKGLTFVSVRGAGHLVPANKPGPALTLFKSFLAGQSLPQFL